MVNEVDEDLDSETLEMTGASGREGVGNVIVGAEGGGREGAGSDEVEEEDIEVEEEEGYLEADNGVEEVEVKSSWSSRTPVAAGIDWDDWSCTCESSVEGQVKGVVVVDVVIDVLSSSQ